MKVLVVGSGGREHAIIKKLAESNRVSKIYATPGNGGIAFDAECYSIAATDVPGVVSLSKKLNVDLVVVAPDDPLAMGMVDALNKEGIKAFGPDKKAAQIESSKIFSKNLMKKYGIPTAKFESFSDSSEAIKYLENNNTYPVVIKADGLALGKGVIIAETFEDAVNAVNSMMEDHIFGESGSSIVIEEHLTGPEVSVLAFTDSKTMSPMISATDHKRIYDGDKGPNTGGMGTISPSPYYDDELAEKCLNDIFIPTMEAMNKEGRPFKGCLYFGLMITKDGPKVIEYNCRFGDPETQSVLPLLDDDLFDIIEAVVDEKLNEKTIKWKNKSCACVIMASGGYPGNYKKGIEISGLSQKGQLNDECVIYHAGTKYGNGKFYTNGGRTLGVSCVGDTLDEALDLCYKNIEKINFDSAQYRKDIGRVKKV